MQWNINKEIIEKRANMPYTVFIQNCLNLLKHIDDRNILSGIGKLLDDKQKTWVKPNLRKDTIFLLELLLENHIKFNANNI